METNTRATRVYIAGPMRGKPEFNFPAFFAAENFLTLVGFYVFNPARVDETIHGKEAMAAVAGDEEKAAQIGLTIRSALNRDTAWITDHADAIYMLNGWEASSGARAEWALANALGLDVYYETKPLTPRRNNDA